jgi:hypothetical protein
MLMIVPWSGDKGGGGNTHGRVFSSSRAQYSSLSKEGRICLGLCTEVDGEASGDIARSGGILENEPMKLHRSMRRCMAFATSTAHQHGGFMVQGVIWNWLECMVREWW